MRHTQENDNSFFLTRAIEIYDSLSTRNKDNESTYYLAEIKYRILGDLDGAFSTFGLKHDLDQYIPLHTPFLNAAAQIVFQKLHLPED